MNFTSIAYKDSTCQENINFRTLLKKSHLPKNNFDQMLTCNCALFDHLYRKPTKFGISSDTKLY